MVIKFSGNYYNCVLRIELRYDNVQRHNALIDSIQHQSSFPQYRASIILAGVQRSLNRVYVDFHKTEIRSIRNCLHPYFFAIISIVDG